MAAAFPPEPGSSPAPTIRRRWMFGGDEAAWDALAAAIAVDPAAAVPWPISAVGPSTEPGDRVVLWRSGAEGGIAALCEVVDEEEPPTVGPDGRLRSSVRLRVQRALARPIPATRVARVEVLRPIAFFDLLRVADHRLTPEQDRAVDDLLAEDVEPEALDDTMATIRIPRRIQPLVEELVEALDGGPRRATPVDGLDRVRSVAPRGTDGSARASRSARATPRSSTTALADQAATLRARGDGEPFTATEFGTLFGVDVAGARARLKALVEAGLVEEAGRATPVREADGRARRGRPPTLYRLVESTAGS